MTRPTRYGAIVLTSVLALSLGAQPALAFAPSWSQGTAAPGQQKAFSNCVRVIISQTSKGITSGGGPKAGIPAPTNCDHFFQAIGVIG
jgi:hypothetical protein